MIDHVRNDGYSGLSDSIYELYTGAWRYLGWHVPRGTNVYDLDWDVLIILDACRIDLLKEVENDYSFLSQIGQIESVGSMSEEWMAKTFTEEYADEIQETVYVTANVFSGDVLTEKSFKSLDEVWRYGWDDDLGIVSPTIVTDRAISTARDSDPNRLIVHYMQPHHPFIGSKIPGDFESDPFGSRGLTTVEDALRKGEIRKDEYWNAYRENLHLVLEDVSRLLSNMDADRVVISADHGDAVGEWGIYGHPAGSLHPAVTHVPWVVTTATDASEYEPSTDLPKTAGSNVETRLRELGYL